MSKKFLIPLFAVVIMVVSILGGIASSTAEQTDSAVQLTTHPAEDYGPDWSPNTRILFTSNRLGWDAGQGPWYHYDIWVMDQDGANQRPVTNSPYRDCEPSWSPDGTQVVFCRTDHSWTSTDDDIWIVDVDIGETSAHEIFTYGDDQDPDWSPDGTRIAFNGAEGWEIFTITPLGTDLIQVTDFPGTSPVDWPDWSPDGSKIAFVYYADWAIPSIWVVDSDKTYAGMDEATMLTDNGDHPAWSPDGTKIAFSSERSGNWDIWVMNADGSNPVQITKDPADDLRPTWSPDGTKIAFQSNRAGNLDIWVISYSPPVEKLLVKLTGELDYLSMENVKIRLAAIVKDAASMEPVSDADVTIEIYNPAGSLWVSDTMIERLSGTGIYEWESSDTIRKLRLKKGVYLVHVEASFQEGPIASDILEFHIDPEPEGTDILVYLVVGFIASIGVAGLILLRRHIYNKLHRLKVT